MSGILSSLFDPQTPEQQARAAGVWQGLLSAGQALAAAGAPRPFGQVAPGWGQAIGNAAGAFGQGMQSGQQGYYQQADQRDARQRQRDFAAALGDSEDNLTPQQRAIRSAIPAGQRSALSALGPQQAMEALKGILGRAPVAPQVVAPGGSLVTPDGRPLYQAPERPPAPQWVGTPETGYGWATPPPRGGGPSASTQPPAGGINYGPNAALVAQRDALLDASPQALANASAARAAAVGQPLNNPARPGANSEMPGWDAGTAPPTGRINPTIGGGFSPVIPGRPAEVYRPLTAEEAASANLPQGRQFQRNTRTGQITEIGGSAATVNIQPGDTAYDRTRGENLAKSEEDIRAGARTAFNTMARLNRLEQNLGNFTTGPGSTAAITAGALAQRLGVPESVLSDLGIDRTRTAAGEEIRSLTGQMLIGLIGPGGFPAQNFSNADREMLERSLPSLANTPQGNMQIISVLRAQAERTRELSQSWNDFRRTNGSGMGSFDRWQQEVMPEIVNRDILAPILAPSQPQSTPGPGGRGTAEPPASPPGALPRPQSAAEMSRLPPGTQFQAPDGSIRVVPPR